MKEFRAYVFLYLTVLGIVGTFFFLLFAAIVLGAKPVAAHEWYDPECCNDQDCAPIPATSVYEGPGGWTVTLKEGDHPLVHSTIQRTIPYDDPKVRRSQDGGFHACTVGGGILCLYVPVMAF